jgi:hypothetical protein
MNSLKIAHELGQLIARRKTGKTGEFSYVCLRSGEERRGRGEILELVKERNKEGWKRVRKHGGEGESDKEFEGKVRKLVAKLPWETKRAFSIVAKKIVKEEKSQTIKLKDEMKDDTVDDSKDELKETVKIKGIRFCDSMKEESLRKVQNKKEGVPSTQQPWVKQEMEEPVDMLKSEPGEDNDEPQGPDADIVGSMNYRFACLGETCDKMFVKWKPCKKHILVCCGIASNQQNSKELADRSSLKAKEQGAQYRKVGKKKVLLSQPSEQDLVQTVEQYYDSLHNPVNRKHVLGHIRKLYGKGEFRRFGF